MSRYRVSMDIGGTFTDVVAYDEERGTYAAGKASTTPHDLTEGVFAALDQVRRVARRDRLHRPRHDRGPQRVPAAARRARCCCSRPRAPATSTTSRAATARGSTTCTTASRRRSCRAATSSRSRAGSTGAAGSCTPLDEEAVRAAAARVRDEGFGAVAVALLFCYLDPAHELRVEEILREELDEVPISLSHRVAREWREYERTSSAVSRPTPAPVVRRYLERLEAEMQRARASPCRCTSCSRAAAWSPPSPRASGRCRRCCRGRSAARWAASRSPGMLGPSEPDRHRHGRHELRRQPGRRRASPMSPPRPRSRASRC